MSGPRLPVPGSDDGQWGNILNEFLRVEHNEDGTLKHSTATPDTSIVTVSDRTLAMLDQIDHTVNYEDAYIQMTGLQPDGAFPIHNPPQTLDDVIGMQQVATLGRFMALENELDGISQEVFEVYLHLDYSVDPATFDLDANGVNVDGWHILVSWSINDGMGRGIYVVRDGALVQSAAIFDGTHNGAMIWAYRKVTEDQGTQDGPYLYGVYTTEFCSLVELAGPQATEQLTAAIVSYDNVVPPQPATITINYTGTYTYSPSQTAQFDVRVDDSYNDTITLNDDYVIPSNLAQAITDQSNGDLIATGDNDTGALAIQFTTPGIHSLQIVSPDQQATNDGFVATSMIFGQDTAYHYPTLGDTPMVQDVLAVAADKLSSIVDTTDPRLRQMQPYTFPSDVNLALEHAGGVIEIDQDQEIGPPVVNIPASSSVNFPIGTEIDICQLGTGQIQVFTDDGVTLRVPSGYLPNVAVQYGTVTIRKRDTDDWVISGNLAMPG